MKNRKTNFIKLGMLLFGISLYFFTSCERENEAFIKETKYKIEKVTFPFYQNNTALLKKVGEFNNTKRAFYELQNKTENSEKKYTINTNEAIYIENKEGTHHTYTFEISNNNPLELQNIVLSLQDDGNYKAFLTTYQITKQERIDLYNGVSVDLSQRTSIKEINIKQVEYANKVGGGCYELEKVGEEWCNHTDHTVEAHILQGSYCNHPTSVYAWVEEPCPGEETGSGSPSVPLNGSEDTFYNSGGNSSADGGTITTSPIALECDNCSNSLSLISYLNLTEQSQIDWVNERANSIEVDAILNFCLTNNLSNEAIKASKITIASLTKNKLLGPYDTNFFNTINSYIDADLTDPYLQAVFVAHFSAQCAVLKFENPDWSSTRIYWEASKEMIHIALDLGGMVPVVGEVCDLTNGIIYTIEGDGVNATLSFAATIPITGWAATGTKYAIKASTLGTKVRLTWKVLANGAIYFGSSGSKLRKVLGITDATKHAHHLIPWARNGHPIIQKAAKSGDAFHMNEALNGIARPSSLHLTGHSAYSTKVKQILDNYDFNNPDLSIDEAYDFVSGFANHIRTLITNNPTLNSGQIADLISYP